MPRKEVVKSKSKQVLFVELPVDMYEDLRTLAFNQHTSMAAIARQAIAGYLNTTPSKRKKIA